MPALQKLTLFFLLYFCIYTFTHGQENDQTPEEKLLNLSAAIPALDEKISISVTNVSIQEFLRGVANNSGLNIDVSPELNFTVINNFSDVKVRDILIFVCRQFDLDLTVMGNIITVYKKQKQELFKPDKLSIRFDSIHNLFTIDYQNANLQSVVKEITKLTGYNVILFPGIADKQVTGYVQNMPFESALEKFMFANNFIVTRTEDNFYLIEEKKLPVEENIEGNKQGTGTRTKSGKQQNQSDEQYDLKITLLGTDSMNVIAENAPISAVIDELSEQCKADFFISKPIEERVTFKVEGQSFEGILNHMLNGTNYVFKKTGSIFVIGEQQVQGLKDHRIIQLQNRTIDKLVEFLPKSLTQDVEIVEFPDLNSLLVSGSPVNVDAVQEFVRALDKIVPVILIEVMIIDFSKKFTVTTGLSAGYGENPVESGGTVFPEINLNIGAGAFNNFLKKNDHFGIKNMGNVTPNFYLSLKALEEQGLINIRSTPQLSTLNGHEATLTIGNTEYYLEEQSNLIGTQNPVESRSQVYKSLNAELAITIKPIVSGDDQITLSIEVNQSDFTERISPTAPPGSVIRNFKSEIRVKNQEMVLLGGLEEKRSSSTSSGVPFMSRVPVIKWLFSNRKKEDTKSKLNVFIRPSIIG